MNIWRSFLDSLDTPGGHIFLLTGLMAVGIGMACFRVVKAEDVLVGSFAALLAMLRGIKTNGEST